MRKRKRKRMRKIATVHGKDVGPNAWRVDSAPYSVTFKQLHED
jgi:hypothetical protein